MLEEVDSVLTSLDMDDDDDGVPDSGDEFPKDAGEWEDLNNDGLGDNGNPLSLTDRMKLSPGISALAIFAIMSLAGAMNPQGSPAVAGGSFLGKF